MDEQKQGKDSEYLDEDLLSTIKEIENGLESIEQHALVYTPDVDWFENMVVEQKQQLRKRLIFDVFIFSIIALLVLSVVLFTLYNVPVVFFAIQGLVAVFIIGYFSLHLFKQVKES